MAHVKKERYVRVLCLFTSLQKRWLSKKAKQQADRESTSPSRLRIVRQLVQQEMERETKEKEGT